MTLFLDIHSLDDLVPSTTTDSSPMRCNQVLEGGH
jgi:hypothetical protein